MRQTNYISGYDYFSQDVTQHGDGILDTIVKGVTNILTSDKTKDVIVEGAKAAAKSAGDKAGSKLGRKVFIKKSSAVSSFKEINTAETKKSKIKQQATKRQKTIL